MNRRKLRLFVIVIIVFVPLSLILKPSFNYLSEYLSKSEKVNANVLLVEGWLPTYALEMADNEFQMNGYERIITTGLKFEEYFCVCMNGYLVFYPNQRFERKNENLHHTIEVEAYSELDGEHCAHFNMYVNDSLVADFYADKRKRKYMIEWEGDLAKIDSLIIQFVNDGVGEYGDRNLYVKDFIIDHKIKINYQNNSEYDIGELDGKIRMINNFNSYAQFARNILIDKGIDPSLIIAVPGERVAVNRTLTSALAFKTWIDTSKINVKGINIVTLGTHARRTWMTYNKILNNSYNIGIISLPDYGNHSRKYKLFNTLRESLGLIYYRLILIFY